MKLNIFQFFSTCLFFLFAIYSYSPALNAAQEESFYCPLTIAYSQNEWKITDKNNAGRRYADYHQYFYEPTTKLTKNKTYLLDSVSSTFHSSQTNSSCNYSDLPYRTDKLILKIKPEANLEANTDGLTNWTFPGVDCTENLQNSDWYLEPHIACPLKNRVGFVVHNLNITNGIILKSNDINITNSIPSTQFSAVTDEDALYGCGNTEHCKIDILSSKGIHYGYLIIDLKTMNVIDTISSSPSLIQIKKLDLFNSVEINYTS